jgi:starvation-inducible DNA-binding protein
MAQTTGRDQLSEEMIDATLADSFPASDPPSWTLGRDRNEQEEIAGAAAPQTSKIPDKEKFIMKTNIGLSEEQRAGVVKILNTLLSDEYLLYTKTRNYHWNVTGPQFHDLHKFFEEQYTELSEIIDEIAERGRSLDGWAFGTMSEFSQHTRLKEHPGHYPKAPEMIANLLGDHEAVIRQLRDDLETCVDKYHDASVDFNL